MRVSVLSVGFLLTTAVFSMTHLAGPASANEAKVTCLCDCPDDHKIKPRHAAMPVPHRVARRSYAQSGYYSYGSFGPVVQRPWHGAWRVAPNDARIPGPVAYYAPRPGYTDEEGLHIDERGWTGGVGGVPEGGGGGGGLGGTVILANGGSAENGPTYNDYNQSFQQNPSQPGPFQNRLMGGLAPATTSK
jgi:hypothetical protein